MVLETILRSKEKVKERNLHTKEIFERAYGDRDWNWYRGLLAESVTYGMPGKWLDLGAGLGLFVEAATRFGIDCVGLEGSQYGVRTAKERFPALDIRQHFLEDRLPFEDHSISTIMCHQTIEHISPAVAQSVLKESYRVLIKGGVILIYSPCIYDRRQRAEETHVNLYTPGRLRAELKEAGFVDIRRCDSPRMILGNWVLSRWIVSALFRIFPIDTLSATANCIAIKTS